MTLTKTKKLEAIYIQKIASKYSEIDLNVGLVIRNFGTQLKAYDEIYEKLQFEIEIRVSQEREVVAVPKLID